MSVAKDLIGGSWFMHDKEPWQVKRVETVVCGTHSHSKTKLHVKNLYGGGERVLVFAHQDPVEIVDIFKKAASVISKSKDKVQIMDTQSYETLDADISKELFQELNEGDNVTFVDFNGKIIVLEKRTKA